jgi:hypothetical protein
VDGQNAINGGGLAGNSKFFGGATADIVSNAGQYGNWNGDWSWSMHSSEPWANRGGQAINGLNSGVFALENYYGDGLQFLSHRTILSGY